MLTQLRPAVRFMGSETKEDKAAPPQPKKNPVYIDPDFATLSKDTVNLVGERDEFIEKGKREHGDEEGLKHGLRGFIKKRYTVGGEGKALTGIADAMLDIMNKFNGRTQAREHGQAFMELAKPKENRLVRVFIKGGGGPINQLSGPEFRRIKAGEAEEGEK